MTKHVDLVVIGTGTSGSIIAKACRSAGWSVVIIDSRPFGGTCALRGCDPKKVLVGAAEVVDWARRMGGKGVVAQDLRIDWPALIAFKRTFTEPVPEKRETTYHNAGIETLHGVARFIDETTVQVGDQTITGRYVAIAAGGKPSPLSIPGEEYLTHSDAFLDLDSLPPRLLMVGGGYISIEFAHVAARAGAKVTILHENPRPLEHFDPDLVERLVQVTRNLGVDFRMNATVAGIEKTGQGYIVQAEIEGCEATFETDLVVHGAGRVPAVDELALEKAGVKFEKQGISVNEYLQSISNPNVYAAGDIAASGAPPLTPVSSIEGHVVAENLLKGNHKTPDFTEIPSMVFSIPPLGMVGMLEDEARQKGLRFRVVQQDMTDWYYSRRINEPCSAFKVLIEAESDRILGAHMLGAAAEHLINIFAIAIRYKFTPDDLKQMTFAFPTAASSLLDILQTC